MKPYYDHAGITIYHGDCREILPGLSRADLVLTDPPYGIAAKWQGGASDKHGWRRSGHVKIERNTWDARRPDDALMATVIQKGEHAIIWGGNYFSLPASRCWLVWNKPERGFTLAEAELAWTNADNVVRVFDCARREHNAKHPTQKPLKLLSKCLDLTWTRLAQTILDPFMGSGTTLRAAKDLGRKAIGIETEESYCEIAARRLAQEVLI